MKGYLETQTHKHQVWHTKSVT